MMDKLSIATYNVRGVKSTNWRYLRSLIEKNTFILIQEHWLHSSEFHLFGDRLSCSYTCSSGMADDEITRGRPFGGCAILWRSGLNACVEPVECMDKRLTAVKFTVSQTDFLLFSVYMPCDTETDHHNASVFDSVLREISDLAENMNIQSIICGGDFNTDLSRTRSLHTQSLTRFLENESFVLLDNIACFDVSYTYESTSNHARSIIDHFMVSFNLESFITSVKCDVNVDNTSDHNVLSVSMNLKCEILIKEAFNRNEIMWTNASDADLLRYKERLDASLDALFVPWSSIVCRDFTCINCSADIVKFHDDIVNACIRAADDTLPKRGRRRAIPGWNDHVKAVREQALFWHSLWKANGCPRNGHIFEIRKSTRMRYHLALRQVRKHEEAMRSLKMAQGFCSHNKRDFWSEIKKCKGGRVSCPTCVDGVTGDDGINDLFSSKFEELYSSVPYDNVQMNDLLNDLEANISNHAHDPLSDCHDVHVHDVVRAVKKLKAGKNDGHRGLFTNHVIHGSRKLSLYLSMLFSCMICHCNSIPPDFALSTIVPIPKNNRKSLNNSTNYRAIALSSIFGKLLDHIILHKNHEHFSTSCYQFGFKAKHSTGMCTFVVNETIQYYLNRNNDVYCTLLDATKAFDRVEYVRLFRCLIEKGICPIVCRFLAYLYTRQCIRVRWGNVVGTPFPCRNGVKQGGVMSPILYSIYMDQLLTRLHNSPYGCEINRVFMGAFAYADDLILLSPTVHGTRCMLNICETYGQDFNVMFNPSKSKLIVRTTNEHRMLADSISLKFMNGRIDTVLSEKHLGNLIGNVKQTDIVNHILQEFRHKTNFVKYHFKNLPVNIMYSLFKTHCMPLYGSQLLDLDHCSMKLFYTSWRKSVRFVLNLPYRTHCNLLNTICDDQPIETQMYVRFLKFYKSLCNSSNSIVSICCELLRSGTSSPISNSLTKVCDFFHINRLDAQFFSFTPVDSPDEIVATSRAIVELLDTKTDFIVNINNEPNSISLEDCIQFLNLLCTQ